MPFYCSRSAAQIPSIGLGTFGSDRVSGDVIAEAVLGAVAVGYRHFDFAAVYNNELLIEHWIAESEESSFGSPLSSGTTSTPSKM